MKKTQKRAIKQILEDREDEENLIERLEEEEISLNRILHLYHETGRESNFREIVKNFFEDRKPVLKSINKQIELNKKEIKKMKKIKEGLAQDYIKENVGEENED